ncbi:hypothetical protein MXB_356 [Myxobolus squamalis]|nr:hypothetical protein MXB_356 [Myxobolus squamalis]
MSELFAIKEKDYWWISSIMVLGFVIIWILFIYLVEVISKIHRKKWWMNRHSYQVGSQEIS